MTLAEYREKEAARISRVEKYLEAGVEFEDINTAYIDEDVKIGKGTYIGPCVTIEAGTVIGENCRIYQNSRICGSVIGDGVEIESSVIKESAVGSETTVGPFAYIRPDCHIADNVKIGDFVEVKNSTVGKGTKIPHLTYIGDTDAGEKINFGCGTITVNYDGSTKHRTVVEDNVFVGCNANLVAPVTIHKGSYIAAGSTITKDVPEDVLAVARARQQVINGWVKKH